MCRISNLGSPRQICLISDPEPTVPLPCRDSDWDRGVSVNYTNVYLVTVDMKQQKQREMPPSTLLSPPKLLGRFSTVVQSAYLLSCVQKLVSDTNKDIISRESEIEQLDRTLHALIYYSATISGTTMSIICYQTALAFKYVTVSHGFTLK